MSALMGMVVYSVGLLPLPNYWSVLPLQLAAGVVIYIVLCRMFRLKAFIEIWQWGLTWPHQVFEPGRLV